MWSINVFMFVVLAFSFTVSSENAVICYYGTWATYRYGNGKFDVEHIDPHLCTHLIYAFAGINNQGNVISLDPWLDLTDNWGRGNFGKFNALKQKNSSLKTLLAVGGWNEGSAKYSTMAASASLRKNFIESAIKILTDHGFNGLDLDWEYPNRRDSVHGEADINNFTKLLRELREAFDKHGLILTAAVASVGQMAALSYDIPAISEYLDIVNIMTYDMHGSWDGVTGHNAPLHKREGDNVEDLFTVDQALRYWINAGCPPEKIAVGIPFYAHTYNLANNNINGVGAPSSGPGISGPFTAQAGLLGYNEVCYKLQTESWTTRFDSDAKVPYAFKDSTWISYDNANSIATKIDFAKKLGINKAMIWSIETDDFHGLCGDSVNPLLRAINNALGYNYEITTKEPASTVSSTAGSSFSTIATTESPKEFICVEEGFAPNPANCSSFYRCVRSSSGTLIANKFQCPATLYWSQADLSCNHQFLVECNVS